MHGGGRCRRRRGLQGAEQLTEAAFGEAGTREFFAHVRFHQHEDERIVVHVLIELYAQSAEEATQVLENAARGELTIKSLAEESRPPASTGFQLSPRGLNRLHRPHALGRQDPHAVELPLVESDA